MPGDNAEALRRYFEFVWREQEGFVYLPTIHKGQQITKYMYEWPRQKNAVVKHVIQQDALGNDVFYSPALYSEAKPEQESVLGTHVFWVDFDGNAPESWEELAKQHDIPEPTLRISSSVEGREHAYWSLANFESNVEQINSRNRALAYTLGADTGGWDANQFLRPPFTHNYGYNNRGEHKEWYAGVPAEVRVTRAVDERINPNRFNALGTPERLVADRIVLGDIPPLAEVFMDGRWPEAFRRVFNYTKDEAGTASPDGRSGTLASLGYFGAENGFTDEQIYAILLDADNRWEKYKGRHDQEKRLVEIIARARAKHGYMAPSDITLDGIIGTDAPVVTDKKMVYSFRELADLDIKVDWMLQGLLRNEGVGIITGAPGVGKTQLAIQLGAHVALGWDFIGWKNLTTPKKVLMFSLEMDLVPLSIFWRAIKGEYATQIEDLHRNFQIVPLGEGIPFESKQGQMFVDKIIEQQQPDLVIIDSLQKITAKELSDEVAVKMMLEFSDKMRIKHHTAMVFVHHNRKKSADASNVADLDELYGSRYIGANVEFAVTLRRIDKKIVNVTEVKNRLGETRDSFDIMRNEHLQYALGRENLAMEGLTGERTGFVNSLRDRLIQGPTSERGTGTGMLDFG